MKLTQAILPVAGFGTRFLPWTKVVPKELLPIGGRPIIALLVDECMSVGIHEICFVISRGKEAIPQFFYAQPQLEQELQKRGKLHLLEELTKYNSVSFHVAYQEEMKGDGHAILQAREWVKSDTIAILFGDDIIRGEKNGLEQLVRAFRDLGSKPDTAMLCLQDVPKKLVSKYGIVDIQPSPRLRPAGVPDKHKSRIKKIQGLVEKPKPEEAPSTLGIVGKYLVPRSTIEELGKVESGHPDREVRLIDALRAQIKKIHIYGYEFEGRRFDTGTPEGYREAVKELG